MLGLPSTFVPLGWAGGLSLLLFSFWVSWYTYALLVRMHELPLPGDAAAAAGAAAVESGGKGDGQQRDGRDQHPVAPLQKRFDRYQQLTVHAFGPRAGRWALLPFQTAVLVGLAIVYTVVGGDDLHAVAADHAPRGRAPPQWACYAAFGAAQALLSQLPDFSSLGWVSLLGAACSVGYSAIATGLAAAHGRAAGGAAAYAPRLAADPLRRAVDVFAAISTILFAYGGVSWLCVGVLSWQFILRVLQCACARAW